jgi:hydroxymethylpyrimidine/phosphomethylpyrimidine kinase
MLANAAIIDLVARKIAEHRMKNVVVDPVMVATSGDLLIQKSAITVLRRKLIPLATIVTPNIPEAEVLTSMKLRTAEEIREAARRIINMGARTVVVKGGHLKGSAMDLFFDGRMFTTLNAPRIRTSNTHGTGCTLSAAIAANLANRQNIASAVANAKRYITDALRYSYRIGSGHGPVHHFFRYWKDR